MNYLPTYQLPGNKKMKIQVPGKTARQQKNGNPSAGKDGETIRKTSKIQ